MDVNKVPHPTTDKAVTLSQLPGIPVVSAAEDYFDVIQVGNSLQKIYRPTDYPGIIDLRDNQVIREVVRRELLCMLMLAPRLNASVFLTNQTSEVAQTIGREAIAHDYFDPIDVLEARIKGNRFQHVPEQIMRQIAVSLNNFHSNREVCTPVGGALSEFLLGKIQTEAEKVRTQANKVPEHSEELLRLLGLGAEVVQKHTSLINLQSTLLHEPIVGHGDFGIKNIVITKKEVSIIGSSPVPSWRTTTRRGEAKRLQVELIASGYLEAADRFWNSYDTRMVADLSLRLSPNDRTLMLNSFKITDPIDTLLRTSFELRWAVVDSAAEVVGSREKIPYLEGLLQAARRRMFTAASTR